ncbi:MAG: phosphatase PAP2 family protein [Prevotella sp.]|jgi:undecaprenyl-diphosphatase
MTFDNLQPFDLSLLQAFNDSHSLFADALSCYFTSGFTWVPLYIGLFILVMKNNETMTQVGLVLGCTAIALLLSGGVDDLLVKPLVGRLRPSCDPLVKYSIDTIPGFRGNGYSFFSAHAANTMSIAVLFIWLVRDRLLSGLLVIWSLINCWTRLYLGVHYPSDILVGLLWGAASGSIAYLLFHHVYYRFTEKINYISTQYSSTGYSKNDIDIVVAIFVMTLAVVILLAVHTASSY